MRLCNLSQLPDDFQQLLLDLLTDFIGDEIDSLPENVPVKHIVLRHRRAELLREIQHWRPRDWKIVVWFSRNEDLYHRALPPLIIDHPQGALRDGYHRLAAMFLAGIETWPVIDLSQLAAP